MAQHDYDINSSDAVSGLQFRQDLNSCLTAIKSTNSGASEPPSPIAGMRWLDNSVTPPMLKERNQTNDGWIKVPIEDLMATTIASATTTNIGIYGNGKVAHITGGTTIASLGVSNTGTIRYVIFDSVLTITHNATSLILAGNANITTQSGDCAIFICENGASGYWRLLHYFHTLLSVNELRHLYGVTSNIQTQLTSLNNSIGTVSQNAINAQTAASQAQAARDQAVAVVIPTGATYSLTQLDTRNTIMSKAAFNALAAERRANRAGSGFDEWGKHLTTNPNINEGIWCFTTLSNKFGLGYSGAGGSTISKTNFPLSSINGVIHNLTGIFDGYTDRNIITLPQSPTIYPYGTTLTTEQLALGCITHANASNSGLIINGKFGTDNDTSGWTTFNGATIGVSSGRISITTSYLNSGAKQTFATTVGKEYIVECEINAGTLSVPARVDIAGISSLNTTTNTYPTRISFKFTATSTSHAVQFYCYGTPSASQTFYVDNIAVFPADAISRSDLVFLESWHEDVSEKDFVYPLGNIQYLGGTTDGMSAIVSGSFSGYGTYSLFGTWQASGALVGKGYVWSTMTDAQKKAFVSNPENNCYLDGSSIIQVRYRMRVLQGEDSNSMTKSTVQGKYTSQTSVLFIAPVSTDYGLYTYSSPTYSYSGTSYCIPIALVHRRNQGGYNATYNPNGTKTMTMTPTCIADCFNASNYNYSTGYMGTSTSRPDGLFYDQVSADDFKPINKGADLRTTTKKRTAQNLIEEFAPKVIAGTLLYNNNDTTALTTYKDFMEVRDTSGNRYPMKNKIGNVVTINDTLANKKGFSIVTQNGKQYLQVADDAASDASVQMNLSVTKYDLGVFDA